MAVGDIVSGISADNTALVFQPAAGVQVIILSAGWSDGSGYVRDMGLTQGAVIHRFASATGTNASPSTELKIPIDNTTYLGILAGGVGVTTMFTGIQIS